MWNLLSEPESSTAAVCVSFGILGLILISSVTFCLEDMEEFDTPGARAVFGVIEIICIAAFSTEYVLRLISAPRCEPCPASLIPLSLRCPSYRLATEPAGDARNRDAVRFSSRPD